MLVFGGLGADGDGGEAGQGIVDRGGQVHEHGREPVAHRCSFRFRAHRHRDGGDQRTGRERVVVVEVAAQRAPAQGEHHVVHGRPGRVFDLFDVVEVNLGECHVAA